VVRKKIVMLIPNFGSGGAQRVFYEHGREFSKTYSVVECVFNTTQKPVYGSANTLVSLDVPQGNNIITKIYCFILRVYRLRQLLRQQKADVCISHMEGANWVNVLSGGATKKIICIHGSIQKDPNKKGAKEYLFNKIFSKILYNRADKVVTVSDGIRNELLELGIRDSILESIPNFFYHEDIIAKSIEPLLQKGLQQVFEEKKIICYSGRLSLQKNLKPLFLIIKALVDQKKTDLPGLVLVGEGDLKVSLQEYARTIGLRVFDGEFSEDKNLLEYDVYFLGYQDNPFKYVAKSKISILTSFIEGFPLTIGESLICGTPFISVDCPTGPRQLLAPESTFLNQELTDVEYASSGILMPMLDTEESWQRYVPLWADTLENVFQNDSLLLQLKNNGRNRMQEFSMEAIVKRWEKIIQQMVKQ
jgi:glycosyltransferase involved in cell wall biosynthesis